MRLAELDETGTLGVARNIALNDHLPHFIRRTLRRTHQIST
jgi:hypothetical protein